MGASNYSDAVHQTRMATAAATGTPVFNYSAKVQSGAVANKVHNKLDPAGKNAAGKVIRESFDSDIHPNSRAVSVLFDVTGSMNVVPQRFVEKLNKLMAMLVKKGYMEHPHVLFGAVGDATCDSIPLQVGQFEGGNEMDDALTSIVLEGGGGGTHDENGVSTESYELAMYFMSRHTQMDCFNKRGEKGYLFLLGDETPYNNVNKGHVSRIIGDTLEADIPTDKMLEELRDKFEVFWIIPGETAHTGDTAVVGKLKKMFGERLIQLANPDDVCETIATAIGVTEGYDIHDIAAGLRDVGASADSITRATNALAPYAGSASVAKGATATGTLVASGTKDKVERL